MVKTRTIEIINFEELPAGQNASVAIMSYSGYDIEDASIWNKASLDRGFGRALYIRRHQTSLQDYANGAKDVYGKPREDTMKKIGQMRKYHAIGEDGLADVGQKLDNGDAMWNKYLPVLQEGQKRAI